VTAATLGVTSVAGLTSEILAERGKRYGTFEGHAKITQTLKVYMQRHNRDKWDCLTDDQREALEMIAHKIGRILNGDPDYEDSWRDIAGYAQLVADRLKGVVQ
jgi:predicted GTPase